MQRFKVAGDTRMRWAVVCIGRRRHPLCQYRDYADAVDALYDESAEFYRKHGDFAGETDYPHGMRRVTIRAHSGLCYTFAIEPLA